MTRVYVETNFVLELALNQPQASVCERLLTLAESGSLELAVPAFCLVEPLWTLGHRRGQRQRLKESLDQELRQLRRSGRARDQVPGLLQLSTTLVQLARDDEKQLSQVQRRLMDCSTVLAMDAQVLNESQSAQRRRDLSGPDAVVFASVLCDLRQRPPTSAHFVTLNSKDFDEPRLVEDLADQGCLLHTSFKAAMKQLSVT